MEVKESVSDYMRFLECSSLANAFQSRQFCELWRKIGWDPFVLGVVNGENCYGGLLAYVPHSIPVVSQFFLRTFVYFGPLVEPRNNPKVLDLLLSSLCVKAKRQGAMRIDVRAPILFPQQDEVFLRNGFVRYDVGGEYSVHINLRKEVDALWSDVKSGCRKRIKRAIRKGIVVRKVETVRELKEFYQIYLTTARRRSFFPFPFQFFEVLWTQLEPRGLAQLLIALNNMSVIAGRVNVKFRGKVTTFISCSLKEFWKLNPNHALLWHSIVKSKEENAHTFSIMHLQSSKPKSSDAIDYHTFKTSFGGSLVKESAFYYRVVSPVKFHLFRGISSLLEKQVQNLQRIRYFARLKN
ncbi:MAG: peptidoglycan bridge formation glycyltransferase FemA/FemB family protein [Candidatus Bathyarchaeota archaeon]|nr:peptidoglycan bridge formation glycyltransferase FemA/FemB family protein [Candidatus Bathyarchaeota archaeon]